MNTYQASISQVTVVTIQAKDKKEAIRAASERFKIPKKARIRDQLYKKVALNKDHSITFFGHFLNEVDYTYTFGPLLAKGSEADE
jgi:hypothetical protein